MIPLGRRFEQWAARHPDRLAVRTPYEEMSYGALNRRANQIAHVMLQTTEAGTSIASLMNSDPTQIATFLAAIKVGRRFVPIDPQFPVERARFVLADAQARVLVTDASHFRQAYRVGIDDPFLELGGDSLLATQVISRVTQQCGHSMPVHALFDHPTIAALATQLEAMTATNEAGDVHRRRAPSAR